MATPYDLYIRYLATRGGDELEDVNGQLAALSLRPIAQGDLDKAWGLIHGTMPKGIVSQIEKKIYSCDFLQHMKILEVSEMWEASIERKTCVMGTVMDIHEDPVLRLTINALLTKSLKVEEITRLINAKFTTALKETHVDLYRRFFFDPRRMTRSSWKGYLRAASQREKSIIFMALTEPVDVLKTELDLPAQVNVSDTLQWLITKSLTRAKACMSVSTPESSQEARAWIDKIVQLTDKYEKYRSADQHDFAKSLQMEFDFIDDDFETPDDEMLKEKEAARSSQTPEDEK